MPCHLITQTGDLSREASEEMECRKLGGLLGGYIFGTGCRWALWSSWFCRKPTCHSSNFFNKTFAPLLIAGQAANPSPIAKAEKAFSVSGESQVRASEMQSSRSPPVQFHSRVSISSRRCCLLSLSTVAHGHAP